MKTLSSSSRMCAVLENCTQCLVLCCWDREPLFYQYIHIFGLKSKAKLWSYNANQNIVQAALLSQVFSGRRQISAALLLEFQLFFPLVKYQSSTNQQELKQ